MPIRFVTNVISTRSKVPTLSDIVKAAQTKAAMEKGASSQSDVKTAAKGDFGGKKAPPFGSKKCDKCKGECTCDKGDKGDKGDKDCCSEAKAKQSAKTAEAVNEEGKDSGQPKAEAKLVNDPHKDPKLKGQDGGGKSEKGEAESSGQLDIEPLHQKGESTGEKPSGLDTQKSDKKEAKSQQKAKRAQSVLHAFVKIANLTAKQKEFLRKTWSMYYPKSYIDALLADK